MTKYKKHLIKTEIIDKNKKINKQEQKNTCDYVINFSFLR